MMMTMDIDADQQNDATVTMADVQQEANSMAAQQQQALAPNFPPLQQDQHNGTMVKQEMRRIKVPRHRMSPLRDSWENIMRPIVEHMRLLIRMNTKTKCIEMKSSPHTTDPDALQKAADFIAAFLMGFELQDAIALLRIEDLYVDSFLVTDVKMLHGDHLSRAIGRVAGQDGKTKYAIENATRTRIVVADTKIHILGSFANIKLAKNAICALILGSPPGKVYNRMRTVSSRMNERA
jgi:RNA-binding protein PNO1|eukprot:g4599.t1